MSSPTNDLTSTPTTDATATRTIRVEYELPKPPAKVWRALTEPALLEAWLMKNDIRPVVGHAFTMQAPPMHGWDGVVRCEILEVVHEARLAYSWRGGPERGRIDTVVTFTLSPTATGGTHLVLEHSGFGPNDGFAFDGLGKGWREKSGERLRATLDAVS